MWWEYAIVISVIGFAFIYLIRQLVMRLKKPVSACSNCPYNKTKNQNGYRMDDSSFSCECAAHHSLENFHDVTSD